MYNKIMKKKVIENKIQKENRLLSATFELLTENEIQKVSVNDIVNKANVAKGTFYLYFKDKYEIRDILIQKETRKLFHQSIEELNQNDIRDFEDRIIFIINHVILQFQMHPEILNFIKKNLSWGLFQSTLNEALNHDTYDLIEIFKKDASSAHYTYKNPEVILYMIIELSGNTCYDAIARKKPLDIEEYKPYLFDAIRAILQTGKES